MCWGRRWEVRRLSSLVHHFFDFSRLEGGHRLVVHLQRTELAELIDRAVATWGRNHPIDVDLEAGLPWVVADPERLEQVLANLLSNAVKFSPPDSLIAITAGRARKKIVISVTDRGKGIAPA